MPSNDSAAKVVPDHATTITVNIRIHPKLAHLCRVAGATENVTRSAFMAGAAVERARVVLHLQRDEDFRAWLAAA